MGPWETWASGWQPCAGQQGGAGWSFKVPFNLSHSMILLFCDSKGSSRGTRISLCKTDKAYVYIVFGRMTRKYCHQAHMLARQQGFLRSMHCTCRAYCSERAVLQSLVSWESKFFSYAISEFSASYQSCRSIHLLWIVSSCCSCWILNHKDSSQRAISTYRMG